MDSSLLQSLFHSQHFRIINAFTEWENKPEKCLCTPSEQEASLEIIVFNKQCTSYLYFKSVPNSIFHPLSIITIVQLPQKWKLAVNKEKIKIPPPHTHKNILYSILTGVQNTSKAWLTLYSTTVMETC
jgi:hypothetical protein